MSQESSLTGYILKTQDLGEADLLLTFFSREEGKVRFVVKSAKKMTSRLAGRLQPTALLEITLAGKSALPTLISVSMAKNHAGLLLEQDRIAGLMVAQELCNRVLPDHAPNYELFEAYSSMLAELEKAEAEEILLTVTKFLTQGLDAAGLAPRKLTNGSQAESLFFSNHEGRFAEHASSVDDLKVTRDVYELFIQLSQGQTQVPKTPESAKTLLALLNNFATYQLERPLHAVQHFLRALA